MRILYALDSYRPNIDGVGVSTERQAQGLAARGHQAALIVPAHAFSDFEERAGGLRILRVRTAKFLRDQWRLAIVPSDLIDKAFDGFRPDVVVVSLPFPLGLRVARAAWQRHVPMVGITGTMPEWLIYSLGWLKPVVAGLYDRLWEALVVFYNHCDVVVGVTETARQYLVEHGLQRPTEVISNGVDLQIFRPRRRDITLANRLGLPAKPTVLYTGRLDAEKRVEVLVRAIPAVLENLDAHFIIGGDGSERERLVAEVEHLGVSRHVTFSGFLGSEEYPNVYSLAEVFAIASPAELQSIVTLEAAACGLPVVAVNAGALPELVRPGRNGFLFEEGDVEQLAEYLTTALENRERARWMGAQSRRIARHHDIARTIACYEELYQELAARPARQDWRAVG